MNAKLMLNERYILSDNVFVEMVVWSLSPPVSKSHRIFKYRLALVVDGNGNCVLRYDNEPGKSGHKHTGEDEIPYVFTSPELLFKVLSGKRWYLLKVMTGAGPISIREAARLLGRDVKAVHGDVHKLLNVGILRKTDKGQIEFPFDAVHVDFMLEAA